MPIPAPPDFASAISAPGVQVIGLDIGGTKCAVSVLREGGTVDEVGRFPTRDFEATWTDLENAIRGARTTEPPRFGVSCGGPLDAPAGRIIAPPNLPPSWHGIPIVARLRERFGGEASLMNDANACALAEWRFGAGRGTRHMVFLTAGTGLGGGLVLNGQLYEGATGDAGEVGHVRLAPDGPVGYGKAGSFEGFCSGGGIARLAGQRLSTWPGPRPAWAAPDAITARAVAEAAAGGEPLARAVMEEAARRFGEGLAILIDLFNPERVVIGGIYPRCQALLRPGIDAVLAREALPLPLAACRIVPAELGETIGSHGAICVALRAHEAGAA